MEIITNDRLIRRNSLIGKISSIIGLLVLAGGMYISFTKPELYNLSLLSLLAGFALSQVGIYFSNRWGRRPRPDELLNQALKGLDGRYRLYHYRTPASHLLVGPAGIWVLIPFYQRGTITYDKGRWRQKGSNLYLKIFAQEGLGRPDQEVQAEVEAIKRWMIKNLQEGQIPEILASLVFTNDRAEVLAENAPIPTLPAGKLKVFIRKVAKNKPISLDLINKIQQLAG